MIDSFHPELQIAFAVRLEQMEEQQLGAALARVVQIIGVSAIDAELARAVPPLALNKLAAYGLRGETFFPLCVSCKSRLGCSVTTGSSTASPRRSSSEGTSKGSRGWRIPEHSPQTRQQNSLKCSMSSWGLAFPYWTI
ncbi:MAG: XcyI family restriction endonuclease [Dehalococcoidia bacterium]|nr:XcyI family restriction endonuclease [Dehalococcoidia bacterium]